MKLPTRSGIETAIFFVALIMPLAKPSVGADPAQIQEALQAYRAAYNDYNTLKMSSGN